MIRSANTFIQQGNQKKRNFKGINGGDRELTSSIRLGRQQRDGVVAVMRKSSSRDVAAASSISGRWSPAASAAPVRPRPCRHGRPRRLLGHLVELDGSAGHQSQAISVVDSMAGGRGRQPARIPSSSVGQSFRREIGGEVALRGRGETRQSCPTKASC
jgi:hypothetical protein